MCVCVYVYTVTNIGDIGATNKSTNKSNSLEELNVEFTTI